MQTVLPSILNWYYPGFFSSNVVEDRLSEVKVMQGWITPTTIVVRKRVVWWAKVCSRDND